MAIDRIYTNLPDVKPSDLFRTVPQPATVRPQPVDIPGVLNQTRNLYKPYNGQDTKDK